MRSAQRQPIMVVKPFSKISKPLVPSVRGNPAQHGIGESGDPLPNCQRRKIDRCGDGCLSRDPHRQDLVRPESQQIDDSRLEVVQLPPGRCGDDHVVSALPAAGAGEQLGRECRVASGQAALTKQRRHDQIGVSPVGVHLAQGVECGPPCSIRTARSGRGLDQDTSHRASALVRN